jgi:hypothetical protein
MWQNTWVRLMYGRSLKLKNMQKQKNICFEVLKPVERGLLTKPPGINGKQI